MNILSFDNSANKIKRDPKQEGLFNLFQKNIIRKNNINLAIYIVPREFEMRPDKISNYLYGSTNFAEELMVLNDIINPYSVKEGQVIFYCAQDDFQLLYVKDDLLDDSEIRRQKLITAAHSNIKINKKETIDTNLPPTVKPSNLQQVKLTKDNRIKIINSFE